VSGAVSDVARADEAARPGRYRAGAWLGARGTEMLVKPVEFRIH
jgi:hypothetical protein